MPCWHALVLTAVSRPLVCTCACRIQAPGGAGGRRVSRGRGRHEPPGPSSLPDPPVQVGDCRTAGRLSQTRCHMLRLTSAAFSFAFAFFLPVFWRRPWLGLAGWRRLCGRAWRLSPGPLRCWKRRARRPASTSRCRQSVWGCSSCGRPKSPRPLATPPRPLAAPPSRHSCVPRPAPRPACKPRSRRSRTLMRHRSSACATCWLPS